MFFTRLVSLIFIYCAVVVHRQALAGGQQRFLTPDETVAVSVTQNQDPATVPSVKTCFRLNGASSGMYNVRFQEIRFKTTSFKRVMLDMKVIALNSEIDTVNASSITNCAEKTFEAGFAAFHHADGVCSMFTLRHQLCRCDAGSGEVIYVQDFFWDAKDRVLPKYVPNGEGDLVRYTRFSNDAIIDQLLTKNTSLFLLPSNWQSSSASTYPGRSFPILVNGVTVGVAEYLDVEHCSIVDCDHPSKYTVHDKATIGEFERSAISPSVFVLSECGKTVTLESNEEQWGEIYLTSHKGFGCDWYPKPEVNHTCVVTIEWLEDWLFGIEYTAVFMDGNDDTAEGCTGDFLEVYSGNNTDPANLIRTINYCTDFDQEGNGEALSATTTFAFTRTATQYQPKNQTNFGFSFLYFLM